LNTPNTVSRPRSKKTSKTAALRRAETLLEVSRRCAAANGLDGVLRVLVDLTARALDCDRGTLFLNDAETGELYSRVAQGELVREIRIPNTTGLAGHVFQTGGAVISHEPYSDARFNRQVDDWTGYTTRNLICVPVRLAAGEIIGVMQCLNKNVGSFTDDDLQLLIDMTAQSSIALYSMHFLEHTEKRRQRELDFLNLVSEINQEFDLSRLLQRVVAETIKMLGAERATIFIFDAATKTLFSRVAIGADVNEIRFPSHLGIAGETFTTGKTLNIPHAYADLRFNPSLDRQTGFFTRSILCTPILNKSGVIIGVTQVLNKGTGAFTQEDEQRLKAFTAQVAIALENSKLFDDVQRMKSYNDSILQSMSNAVMTLDGGGMVVTCNGAGLRIWERKAPTMIGKPLIELLDEGSQWLTESIAAAKASGGSSYFPDAQLALGGVSRSVNISVMPLRAADGEKELGAMLMFEDISTEKRMKSTMSRYMDPAIAAQMLEGDSLNLLGGANKEATVMFTDVRGFTAITEEYGAQGTVSFLNEYFTLMVECINKQGGMLDKFIGDAIMACFGLPAAHEDDPDRAVKAAISMIRELWAWNGRRRQLGLKTVDMGVGLNTDIVVSGNIGSPKRMDYTVIGDGVNLASRLESACKTYSAHILASESTISKLRGIYRYRDIDLVVVKGKTQPVRVYEILDYHDATTFPNIVAVITHFDDAMRAYRGGDWARARAGFEQCRKLNPEDQLSATYMARCDYLASHPPEGEWDGVWVMKDK
jgi:adenylate cyclase